jgi:hypothetical protein
LGVFLAEGDLKMGRDKKKDDKYFSCSQEHELNYISGLYQESQKVYDFLKGKCQDGSIKYSTHREVYQMIEDGLGYPSPN